MKTLYLIRHAKSDWDNTSLLDIERPLNERGYREANKMSLLFKEKYTTPKLIISSPAIRAISTALIFTRNLIYNPNQIVITDELYETSINEYLSVIASINNQFDSVMLFGHNPTISDVANLLAKSLDMEMPTGTIVGISFNIDHWNDIETTKGELVLFDYPRKG